MDWGRPQTGASAAAALVAGAGIAYSAKAYAVTWLLVGVAVALLVATLAPRLPGLNRLPVIGAPKISLHLSFDPAEAVILHDFATVIFRVGVENHGPGEVHRARVNVLFPASVEASQADGFGNPKPRGERLPNTDEEVAPGVASAYWFERHDFDEDSTLLHYMLRISEPGLVPVRVKIDSKSLPEPCVGEAQLKVTRAIE